MLRVRVDLTIDIDEERWVEEHGATDDIAIEVAKEAAFAILDHDGEAPVGRLVQAPWRLW